MKSQVLAFIFLLSTSLGLPLAAQAQPGEAQTSEPDTQSGTLVFKLKSAATGALPPEIAPQLAAALRMLGATKVEQKFPRALPPTAYQPGSVDLRGVYQVWFAPTASLQKARFALLQTGTLEYAEPLYDRGLLRQPNDPFADSTRADGQYYLKKIQAYRAWDVTQGDTSIVIGVLDTGMLFSHQDMQGQIKYNYADPIDGIDNDGDGYVDNFRGWDFADQDNDPAIRPTFDHGLMVAGCASARPDNKKGIAGVGFRCKVLPIKVFSNRPGRPFGGGFEAIVYAADHGCRIINLSWGSVGGQSQYEQDVINYAAINRDAVVVAAAGNDGRESDYYPASYANVLSVAALTAQDTQDATYSTHVTLSAPGRDILTAWYVGDSSYAAVRGSSFAAPIVAGAAALVRARFPQYSAVQVAAQLRQTTDDIYSLAANAPFRGKLGTGRLNVHRAVALTDRHQVRVVASRFAPQRTFFRPNEALRLTAELQNQLRAIAGLTVTLTSLSPYLSVQSGTFSVGSMMTLGRATNTASPFLLTVAVAVPPNTHATLRYAFTSTDGYTDEQLLEVVLNPDYVVLDAGNLRVSLNSRGNLAYDDAYSSVGAGVTYQESPSLLAEGGLLVGTSPTRVADRIHNDQSSGGRWRIDDDFQALSQVALQTQPVRATQEGEANFQNSRPAGELGAASVGVRVRQRAAAWADAPHRDYVMLEYQLTNITPDTLKSLHAGLYLDWDLPPAISSNLAEWDAVGSFGYVRAFGSSSQYTGVKHLGGGTATYYAIDNQVVTNEAVTMGNGFSTAEKFAALSSGTAKRTAGAIAGSDVSQVAGASLGALAPGDSIKVAFALLGGNSLLDIRAAATAAQTRYRAVVLPTRMAAAPTAWQLYPNPTSGKVRMEVPAGFGAQELTVRNALGQVLLHQNLSPTKPITDLDLTELPTGLYVVQLSGQGGNLQRRVVVRR
ncbi:peptidase S8 and S53 subtilisin kexin sedolisin [Hymenobacter roseosalivarius DSM 11622]|uniref:Peptidase S8 and S53 subtilisin kexin sedolisin n=1 Tax=Hymenobacter roseosalivarius DSM 11622 TaxID=645990 RepID=A0A1W1VEN9_9BACT|nr:S8 family peptidase [Hymenobacter roseosalivarius]SMB91795.1 peptidase S8 and S53 subtilisin kexin sedolisin [Hymenobacter roseosalivarius DSM 11622]